ncbi:MAG TPA: hypothetical protein VJP88_00270 [Caulobacteraceae bacterium]|nr:hypothetical protein [Caulobacteraceae bacterium]
MAIPHGLFLDVSCLCEEHTNRAIEGIYKAIGDDPPGDGIWDEHPSPFIRRLVELFTDRGLTRIAGLQEELNAWLAGAEFREGLERAARPDGAMLRWNRAELGTARLYLSHLPPEAWTLEDWLLLVDYLVQRYLPEGDLRSEASWLAQRAGLAGRLQAAHAALSAAEIDAIMQAVPDLGAMGPAPTPEFEAAARFGRERACENVVQLSDNIRHRMRRLVVDYQEAVYTGDRAGAAESLQGRLLDEFGTMNRDWRRIAITESTEMLDQGFVASIPEGGKIKRVERYNGACPFCRKIDGTVMTVVPADKPDKDGETEVWVGKTNQGRSASPRKRSADGLVDRDPQERWWIAAGTMHPHCRGTWVRVSEASPDPEFDAWIASMKRSRSAS